ncbi:MAG TPA: hypothetical protein VD884_00905 [Ohtaekwangia sp.]|nr:hypothetical protein [Ohtaekwangia sp.]
MDKLFYILIILSLTACGKGGGFDENDDLQLVKIEFANSTIGIPKNYKLKSPEEIKESLLNSSKRYSEISETIQKLDYIKSIPTEFQIYVDTLNYDNNIWFQEGQYVRLTKSLSQQYLSALETQLQKQWTPQDIKYERLESKFLSGTHAQLIKLKYKLSRESSSTYTTQYLISSNSKTIGVIINNVGPDDMENLVSRTRMK